MLFRPSLPWGFAAGSGSILGDCLLKMPFWAEGVAGAGVAAAAGGNRSYIREFWGAILMLFRPSLPWGFAAGSGSIFGDCLLKMSFWTEGVAGAGQEQKVAKIIPFLLVSEVALGSVWAQFWCFSVLHCHGDLPLGAVRFSATAFWRCLFEQKE